jgi:CRP-like cAMP-binding protein
MEFSFHVSKGNAMSLESLRAFTWAEHVGAPSGGKDTTLYKKNSVLFREGDLPSGVFGICSGLVTLSKLGPHGHAQTHSVLAAGDLAGYRAVFSGQPYSASAIVIERARVEFFPAPFVQDQVMQHPDILMALMRKVCRELGSEREKWLSRNDHNAETRLARCLLGLRDSFSRSRRGAEVASIQFPRPELAAIIGVNSDRVSRLLARLRERGAIQLRGRRILYHDMAQLNRAAELNGTPAPQPAQAPAPSPV